MKQIIITISVILAIVCFVIAAAFFAMWLWCRNLKRFDDALDEALKEKGVEDENRSC